MPDLAKVSMTPAEALTLVHAAQFAMEPETVPVFRAWLERHAAPETIPPTDLIPRELAEAALMLTRQIIHQEHSRPRARGAGAHVP